MGYLIAPKERKKNMQKRAYALLTKTGRSKTVRFEIDKDPEHHIPNMWIASYRCDIEGVMGEEDLLGTCTISQQPLTKKSKKVWAIVEGNKIYTDIAGGEGGYWYFLAIFSAKKHLNNYIAHEKACHVDTTKLKMKEIYLTIDKILPASFESW